MSEKAKTKKRRAVTRWMIIDLALQTGLRASEMCDLLISDIHIGYGQNSIFVREGKGGKSANVIINDSLKRHLKQYLKISKRGEGPLLITEQGGKYTRQALHATVKGIFKAHKLPKRYAVHSLRHSFCSELYRATNNLRLVQAQARHTSIQTTTVYANLLSEELKSGMESLYA